MFKGAVNHQVAQIINSENFKRAVTAFIATHATERWTGGTAKAKITAANAFRAYLAAYGLQIILDPPPMMEKTRSISVQEEDTLAKWAMSGLMLGQSPHGVLQYVSHVCT